ncbi:MAG: HAD-IB family hydrolase [Bacteroidia bacterium]
MILALFDFDGTLTRRDSMFAFLHKYVGSLRFYSGLIWLAPVLLAFVLRLLAADKAKKIVLRHFLAGKTKTELEQAGHDFCQHQLPEIYRSEVLAKLKSLLEQKETVAVVSASCDVWIKPFCAQHNLVCICTEFAYNEQNKFVGDFKTLNCNGPEKANRVRATFKLHEFETIIAFGDSSGDEELMQLAHQKNWIKK